MQSKYWAQVIAYRSQLESRFPNNALHIIAIENSVDGEVVNGSCKAAGIEVAARHIARGTHRVANEGEIKAYYRRKESERKRLNLAEANRRQGAGNVVVVSQVPQVAAALSSVASAGPTGLVAMPPAQLRKIADGLGVDSRLKDSAKLIAAIEKKSAEVDEPQTDPAEPDETEEDDG